MTGNRKKRIRAEMEGVTLESYKTTMFINGFFNPICPRGYNFLSGMIETEKRETKAIDVLRTGGRVNGVVVKN